MAESPGPVRVSVVGAGLIGGSVALALARADDIEVVSVYDADAATAEAAVAAGAAQRAACAPADAAREADVVFVCVPASAATETISSLAEGLRPGAIVSDTASVKDPIVAGAIAALGRSDGRFVGGHPMAGSERSGFGAASAELFRNASWVLTPTAETDPDAVATISGLVRAAGATPLILEPSLHDSAVATVSHLPQLIASALMNVAARHSEDAPPVLHVAAGGFRDVTRIAAGSPSVWEDIIAENSPAVAAILDEYIAELTLMRESLGDRESVHELLSRAQTARRSLPRAVADDELWLVAVHVSDRPGEFAELTTAVGEAGVNVVDIGLRHSPEGGRGVLHLTIAGERAAETAVAALRERGHVVHRERG